MSAALTVKTHSEPEPVNIKPQDIFKIFELRIDCLVSLIVFFSVFYRLDFCNMMTKVLHPLYLIILYVATAIRVW